MKKLLATLLLASTAFGGDDAPPTLHYSVENGHLLIRYLQPWSGPQWKLQYSYQLVKWKDAELTGQTQGGVMFLREELNPQREMKFFRLVKTN